MYPSKYQEKLVDQVIETLATSTPDQPGMLLNKDQHVIHTNSVEVLKKTHDHYPSLIYIVWLDDRTALYIGKTDKIVSKRIETHWVKTEGEIVTGPDGKDDAIFVLEGKKLKVNHTVSWKTFVTESKDKLGFDFSKANITLFKVRDAESTTIKLFQEQGAGTYANKETYKEYNV